MNISVKSYKEGRCNALRINPDFPNTLATQGSRKASPDKSNGFQDTLEKQAFAQKMKSGDTISISVPKPAAPADETAVRAEVRQGITQEAKVVSVVSNPVINPTDSTEVKLAKLREIDTNANYTGMTDAEIYRAIWDRYNDAFDGNMPAILICAHPDSGDTSLGNGQYTTGILTQFLGEVFTKHGISDEARDEALGYADMSHEEREAFILKKYEGKNTTLDFLNMTGELSLSGVLFYRLGDQTTTYKSMVINGLLSTGDPYAPNSQMRSGATE